MNWYSLYLLHKMFRQGSVTMYLLSATPSKIFTPFENISEDKLRETHPGALTQSILDLGKVSCRLAKSSLDLNIQNARCFAADGYPIYSQRWALVDI